MGKTSQARELFLKAMESQHMEEPNSAIWLGFGLIAQQYGESDAAVKMYERVEKPKRYFPGDSYVIAQQREDVLHRNPAAALAKTAAP